MATNKTVFFIIGILLVVLGISMLAPYAMQLIYDENSHSFVGSSFVTIFIGILFILGNSDLILIISNLQLLQNLLEDALVTDKIRVS